MKKTLLKALATALAVMLVLPVIPVAAEEKHEGYYSVEFEYDEGVEMILDPHVGPIENAGWVTKFDDSEKLFSKCQDYYSGKAIVNFDVKLKPGYEIEQVYETNADEDNASHSVKQYCIDVTPYVGFIENNSKFVIVTKLSSDTDSTEQKPLDEDKIKEIYTAVVTADKYALSYLDDYKWSEPFRDRSFRHGENANSFLAVAAFEYLGLAEYANLGTTGESHIVPYSYVNKMISEYFVKHNLDDVYNLNIYDLIADENEKGADEHDFIFRFSVNGDGSLMYNCCFNGESEDNWFDGLVNYLGCDVYADENGKPAKIAVQGYCKGHDEASNTETIISVDELVLVYDTESGNWKIDEYYPLDFTLEDKKPVYQSEVTGTPYDPESLLIDETGDVAAVYPTDEAEYYYGAVFDAELLTEGELFDAAKGALGKEYEKFVPYSLTLTDKDGKPLPLKSKVTVSVPVPEGWDAKDTLVFFIDGDGKPQAVAATASEDGKYITFETTHFSVWALADASTKIDAPVTDDDGKDTTTPDDGKDTTTPGTGDAEPPKTSTPLGVTVWLAVMLLTVVCGTTVYASLKRRRSAK